MPSNLTLLDLTDAKAALPARKPSVGLAKRSFAAAQMTRFTADWAVSILSRDQKLWQDLRKLRARSRELADNDPTAAKFLGLCAANIIGPRGVQLQAKIKSLRGTGLARDVNAAIEKEWRLWGKRGNCTMDGKLSWGEIERLHARTVAVDGEAIYILKAADNPWGFALQMVDVDQLDSTFSVQPTKGQNEIRMGVEVDKYGKPLAYWLWNRHPNEWSVGDRVRIRVPADSVIHDFDPDSARQSRGVPWMAPSMYQMNMLKGYQEAEVTAARVGACQGFAITSQDSGEDDGFEGDGENYDGTTALEMTPGGGMRLAPGETFTQIKPEHPTTAFASFVKECKRGISNGLQVSYTSLFDDLEGVNFSSIRAGLLNERDTWRVRQGGTIERFHKLVAKAWLSSSVLKGRINISVRDEEEVLDQIVWHSRGWDWVDPLKDAQSSALGVQNLTTTLTRELASKGLDIDELIEERKEELAKIKAAGLIVGTDNKGDATTASDDQEEEGESDNAKGKSSGNAKGRDDS